MNNDNIGELLVFGRHAPFADIGANLVDAR